MHVVKKWVVGALCCILTSAASPARAEVRVVEVPSPTITTLLFHQVTDTPIHTEGGEDNVKRPWVTPERFDALLTALESKGYHFTTLPQALEYLKGRIPASALPPRPVLLTFDDGYKSVWTEVTPILRKHHATAAMFFEGLLTDADPERLTTRMVVDMAKSGSWYVQSHGWNGHGTLIMDANGTENPYWYANLGWNPAEDRMETESEYARRVRGDLRHFKRAFESQVGQAIDVFAYPSGEFGQNSPAEEGAANASADAGHSNANDLSPLLFDALRAEGYTAAFAVSLPGMSHGASRQDSMLTLPRLGVGADFNTDELDRLMTDGIELPEIAPQGTFNDVGPIAVTSTNIWAASSVNTGLYLLARTGKPEHYWPLPALLDDRTGNPSLICAIIVRGSALTVVQQAGWWPGAAARLTRYRIAGKNLVFLERRALPEAANWLVGAAEINGRLIGMTDEGHFVDVQSGKERFTIAASDDLDRHNRFAGPFQVGSALFAYDRKRSLVLKVGSKGAIEAQTALEGDVHNFASSPEGFFAVDWSGNRHVLRQYRIVSVKP